MIVISLAGPHVKAPAKPPIVVATEGTTVVKSTSEILTPGDNWKAILCSPFFYYRTKSYYLFMFL
jgi:hypothetical protein